MDKYLHNVNHEFRDTNEACVVCFEEKGREMKFPSCTHWFCTDCMRKIILGKDEEEYILSPVPYGCPPCPNGCVNPERGRQCNCIEWDNEDEDEGPLGPMFLWEQHNPNMFQRWCYHNTLSIRYGEGPTSCYGTKMCPCCRSETD